MAVINYTEKWHDFQIRGNVNIDPALSNRKGYFDIVKWEDNDTHCLSIATAIWNEKNEYFDFSSIGLRLLEEYEEGLLEWILDFLNEQSIILSQEECGSPLF